MSEAVGFWLGDFPVGGERDGNGCKCENMELVSGWTEHRLFNDERVGKICFLVVYWVEVLLFSLSPSAAANDEGDARAQARAATQRDSTRALGCFLHPPGHFLIDSLTSRHMHSGIGNSTCRVWRFVVIEKCYLLLFTGQPMRCRCRWVWIVLCNLPTSMHRGSPTCF